MTRAHTLARRECYRLLRERNWSWPKIARYFNRAWRSVYETARNERNEYYAEYMRKWRERQKIRVGAKG